MHHLLDKLNGINRPRLLIQAARIGAATYRRELHLRRLFGPAPIPHSSESLSRLLEMETSMNRRRKLCDAGYSAADHVDLLIALMGEARIVRAAYPPRIEPAQPIQFKPVKG